MDVAPPFSEAYFVVLFSALPVLALETLPFANSGMGRELVAMQVEVAPGKSLFVGTSHLESMPQFSRTRVAQLKEAMCFLEERVETSNTQIDKSATSKTCLGAIFMGDTNLMRADMKVLDSRLGGAVADLEVEKAKSARSKCRKCGETIAKDTVRVGKMAKDTLPGGKTLEIRLWYHEECFLDTATAEEKQVLQSLGASNGSTSGSEASNTTTSMIDLATLGLPSGWKDLWLSVDGNTEENGCTFDGKTNALVTSKAFQSRLDRMYFYAGGPTPLREAFAETSSAVLEKIEVVGKEPIGDGLWPSDHFGLLASFKFDDEGGNDNNEKKEQNSSSTKTSSQEVKEASQSSASGSPRRKKMREAAEARVAAASAGTSANTAVEIE